MMSAWGENLDRTISKASKYPPGDIRALGRGDSIRIRRDAISRPDWAAFWIAAGIAVANGADLKVTD